MAVILLGVLWLSIAIIFQPNHLVTIDELRTYGNVYLQTYKEEVDQYSPDDRSYFPDFTNFFNKTTSMNYAVSELHGAAIEFVIDNNLQRVHTGKCSTRIEQAVFGGVGYINMPIIIPHNGINFEFANASTSITTGGTTPFEIDDNASFTLFGNNGTIDGVPYFNPIFMSGDNSYYWWTPENAVIDATAQYKWDLSIAMNSSEGVREYVAIPQLKSQLDSIAYKLKYDPTYGPLQLQMDITNLSNLALQKYGVTRPSFIQDILNITLQKVTIANTLPLTSIEYTNNYWYTLYFSILLDLSYTLPLLLPILLRRFSKKTSKKLKTFLDQILNKFTVVPILILFLTSAPLGYAWLIQGVILVVQWFVLVATIFFWKDVKQILARTEWSILIKRTILGTLVLLCCLSIAFLLSSWAYSTSILFIPYTSVVGNISLVSFLTATFSITLIVIAQQIYGKRHYANTRKRRYKRALNFMRRAEVKCPDARTLIHEVIVEEGRRFS